MKKLLCIFGMLAALLVQAADEPQTEEEQLEELNFGLPVDATKLIPISTLMAQPDQYLHQMVTVEGQIVEVCQDRGCWMEIASDAQYQSLRVKVKDGEMVFPVSTKGRIALAMGEFVALIDQPCIEKEYDAEGQLQCDPAVASDAGIRYQVVPIGVRILAP